MAFINANQTKLIYGTLPLQAYLRSVTPSASVEMLDVTSLADTTKAYVPGLEDFTLNIDGMFDDSAAAGSLWATVTAPITASSGVATSVATNGFTFGSPVWLIQANTISFEPSSSVADIVTFSMAMGSASSSQLGSAILNSTITASGLGVSLDNSVSTSAGFIAQIHVTAASGTTPTMAVIVQHSTNNSTWATLGSFTTATGTTSERISGNGTVNRYVRAFITTVTGTSPSFTTTITLARL